MSATGGIAQFVPAPPSLLIARVLISSPQILNASAVPITIVPAPGPGKLLIPITALFSYRFGTIVYAGGGNEMVTWAADFPLFLNTPFVSPGILGSAASYAQALWPIQQNDLGVGPYVNESLVFGTTVAQVNGDGELLLELAYSIFET